MKKILVTGAKGQLGSELNEISSKYPQFEWVFADKKTLDLSDLEKLSIKLSEINPQYIINAAAYTAVDKAEQEIELADLINHKAVVVLAKWSNTNHAKLIHISTDYVFDGATATPLKESEPTNPINIYGKTKLAGENACLKENSQAIIIRTSWVYSSFGNNFVKTISRLMQEKDSLNVVNDQIGSPTSASDLAKAILAIITHNHWKPGIYNFSNEGQISWHEFALDIKETGNFICNVNGIRSSEYKTAAKRPQYSLLDKTKIKDTFGIIAPNYKESLKICMEKLKHNS